MNARYRLTLAVEFTAGDDPAARLVVTRNTDVLVEQAIALRVCAIGVDAPAYRAPVKLKLQRLNDDAPPRSLVVETL